jgi:hypothetical protein
MMRSSAHFSRNKAQLKIQEMAFVLIAIFVFFGLAALFFLTVNFSGIKQQAQDLGQEQAKQLAFQFASTPEFAWYDEQCASCVDSLRAMLFKDRKDIYISYWNIDYLQFETIYPEKTGECTLENYPNCKTITLVNRTEYYGTPSTAYIALCRHERMEGGGSYPRCELGKIHVSVRGDA